MSIAVIYTRVSSTRQVKKGDGLTSQENRCREFASYKGYTIVETFSDAGVSGGLVDRPAMKDMLSWLRKHRSKEPVVLIDDISRFARGVEAHWKLRAAIGSVGAKLESPSIEFGDDSDSQLIENMLASVSQHQRQKNGEQVVNRMKARMLHGYFAFWVPKGYKYERVNGVPGKSIVRDEPAATLIQEALEGFATGRFQTQSEVKRFLEPHGIFKRDHKGEIHPQRIKNLLTNMIYAGYYKYEPWGVPLTKGKHEALISWEAFQRIQQRLEEGATAPQRKDISEDFPLRGFVTCGSCGSGLTGYWSKGRNRRYAYYECFNKGCDQYRKSIRRDKIEGGFETLLKQLRPEAGLLKTMANMFRDIWDGQHQNSVDKRHAQKQTLAALKTKMSKVTDRLIETDNTSTINALEKKLEALQSEQALIEENLAKPAIKQIDFDQKFRTAMRFLANPWNLWASPNIKARKAVLKMVFAAPLPYCRERGFRTAKTTSIFKALEAISDDEKVMADPEGFEPST